MYDSCKPLDNKFLFIATLLNALNIMPTKLTQESACYKKKTKIQALTEHVSDENSDLVKLVKI